MQGSPLDWERLLYTEENKAAAGVGGVGGAGDGLANHGRPGCGNGQGEAGPSGSWGGRSRGSCVQGPNRGVPVVPVAGCTAKAGQVMEHPS